MDLIDRLKNSTLILDRQRQFAIALDGESMLGAHLVISFKKSIYDVDNLALVKGSESPLTGIVISPSSTAAKLIATLTLAGGDFTSAPLSLDYTKEFWELHYSIALKDATGAVHHISDAPCKIKGTALRVVS